MRVTTYLLETTMNKAMQAMRLQAIKILMYGLVKRQRIGTN